MERRLHYINERGCHFYLDIDNLDILPADFSNENGNNGFTSNSVSERILWTDNECQEKAYSTRHLYRITVCVSNDCNLRCKYCYAQGGNYGMSRTIMSKETADEFVEFCINNYDKIDNIVFFGGEPLLNPHIISHICSAFKLKASAKAVPLPIFSIITNGTICSPDVMSLIRDHISFLTVSIDGNKEINDENRIFANGKGSYDQIAHFITSCKQIPNLQIQYEATYTMAHLKNTMSKQSVIQHLENTFNIKGVVINEKSLPHRLALMELKQISKETLIASNFECLPADFWTVVKTVISKIKHSFCGILSDRITVSTEGDILPCQMLLGAKANIVAKINDKNAIDKIKSSIHPFKHNITCKKCWCFKICGGCPLPKFYSNDRQYDKTPDSDACETTRSSIRECLALLYMIQTDYELKPLFLSKVKELYSS